MQDSFSFQAGRGYLIKVADGSTSSAYAVEGLPTGTESGGAIMLDEINIGGADSVAPTDALGDKHVMYVFGPAFKEVAISGTIYLKVCGAGGGGGGIGSVNSFFSSNRVSSSRKSVNVSIGSAKVGMYVTDMQFGAADAEKNTITFQIRGYARPRK